MAGKIAHGGKPIEPTHVYINELLPIYSSLVHHWRCINKTKNALTTLAEAIAAALIIGSTEEVILNPKWLSRY